MMQYVYEYVGDTKRYAKFTPTVGQPVTGGFYLALAEHAALGKPERITLTVTAE